MEAERNSSRPGATSSTEAGFGADRVPVVVLSVLGTRDMTLLKVELLKDIRAAGILRTLVVTYAPAMEPES